MTGTKLLRVTAEQPAQNLTIQEKSLHKTGTSEEGPKFSKQTLVALGEAETAQACLLGSCHAA